MISKSYFLLSFIIFTCVSVPTDSRIIRREAKLQHRTYGISNYNFAFQCITYKLFDCLRVGTEQCFNAKVNECLRLMQDPSKWYPKQDDEHWYERPWYWFPEEIFPPKKPAQTPQKPSEDKDKIDQDKDKVEQDKDDTEDQTPKYDNSSSSSSSSSDSDSSSSEEELATTATPEEMGVEDNGDERDDVDLDKEEFIEADPNGSDSESVFNDDGVTDVPE